MSRGRAAVEQIVRSTLSAHMTCTERDFDRDGTFTVAYREDPAGFRYPVTIPLLRIVTTGCGVVVSGSADCLAWIEQHLTGMSRDDIFSFETLTTISAFLKDHQLYLAGPDIKYVCSADSLRRFDASRGHEIRLFRRDEMEEVYRFKGFRYGLSYRRDHPRPDMMAAVAFEDDEVVGIAGASADSEEMWQIGVGVATGHRQRGLGRALVGTLTQAVLEEEKVPFYSTWPANVASNALAQSLGFRHMWTELYSRSMTR